jgi:Na+-translocating ferredoxin:NAD+ oxidoreductase RnfD subunit
MVTDPPTSPPGSRDQVIFGAIVGAASYAVFEAVGAAYFLLAGLLVANAWEARRRAAAHRARLRG